ncbi:rhomboid domain-containing protein [Chloropicon primus]|uniref:Rhomboid domain-containing protein n=2 Tax=Chloropicon primus TaxID=1764295 RepID=A0A5B8N074_9CHLO|nr:rhomboid domain-containing protein [Chloropicon primus]UPR04365.1 rhomboid domain-containing protein [Chloropicon primus]|eukprot:QDZ25160.1 rhomboid domain-containing protein [Chloropicon primus]
MVAGVARAALTIGRILKIPKLVPIPRPGVQAKAPLDWTRLWRSEATRRGRPGVQAKAPHDWSGVLRREAFGRVPRLVAAGSGGKTGSAFQKVFRRQYHITNSRGGLNFNSRQFDNHETVLYGLMGLNAAVFASWHLFSSSFMLKHFACSTEALRNLRPWTLVTSMFSQFDFSHFAVNMLGLYFWGRDVGQLLGGKKLLGLYLAGGLAGAAVQLALDYSNQKEYRWGQPRERYCLGASAAVNSMVTLNILLFPKSTVLLYFFIPVPAALLGGLFLARDFSGLYDSNSGTSHAGHLGGAAVGFLYWLLRFRRFY